ncbi:3-deoxy-D-manno-octulosonic acid transferase [Paragemmobacter ruber]|uniref:3-deoxy-D-manno-octulosonic acid transferase n=1 Tax=Paragemmobacter ruber TaxID=1985673 RepID=A0ABW9Y8P7_9RHOB|nr:3-deoxy-D-manno-octulosonic acid transferase [Rhodobacter ruber]NBE08212.1 3-deoxy-D-manno-octulosonic acid transferase [Rhodobacter ruber]
MTHSPAPFAAPMAPPPRPPGSALLALWLGTTAALAPFGATILRRRLARGKEDAARWPEKLGRITLPRPEGALIWLHAVSVGEGLSVLPLLRALVARAGTRVLLTCTTVTAMGLMQARVPEGVIVQYLPLDLPGPVTRFLSHWRPDVAVMVESEFWPRLIHATHARGIPLVLANARMSEGSARAWARVPGLARAILGRFTALAAPDAAMAARLVALGADQARLQVMGTLKRAAERLPVDPAALAQVRAGVGGRPVWLAASTHPGEEAVVAEAHRAVRAVSPDALLILAPRHPARAGEIAAQLSTAGLDVALRSRGEAPDAAVYLADTLGEMGLWFDLCPIAFVGGSLLPGIGGHNAYEPALHGSAILHGRHVGNFADLYARLDAAGGAQPVVDAGAMAAVVLRLMQDGAARAALVAAARDVLATEADGVAATSDLILSLLPAV